MNYLASITSEPTSRPVYALVTGYIFSCAVWNSAKTAFFALGTIGTLCQSESLSGRCTEVGSEALEGILMLPIAFAGIFIPDRVNRWIDDHHS